jgi:hypothetical protein
MNWNGKRVVREHVQTNPAAPERVFPLLCPVREAEWVPGWQYRMIYSQSGVAEEGCVFTTPNDTGPESTWLVTEYRPPRRIDFVWIQPGRMAARLRFELAWAGGQTNLHARYEYTGLSLEGDAQVERFTEAWFESKMQRFQAALNHYLQTGKMIQGKAWE